MKKVKYGSKNPIIKKSKIQKYGERLTQLLNNKISKELTPEDVINDAKKSSSPLHDYFEWDNTKAGHLWRLQQARQLLCSIVVVNGDEHKQWYNVRNQQNESVYVECKTVLETPSYAKQVIDDCLRYIEGFQRTLKLLRDAIK